MGNRLKSGKTLTNGLQTMAYSPNLLNQYTNIVVSNSAPFAIFCSKYSFDPNGNQLTHYRFEADGSIVTNYLVWDLEDRLSAVLDSSSNIIAEYYYDPFGRRLKKTVGTNVTYFVYADEGLVAEADSGGTITTTYGFNPGSLWMNNPLFQRTFTSGTNSIYFLTDHLGAPQSALNSSGMEAWGIVQEAFGRAETLSGSSVDSNLRFSSQYLDSESGLAYNLNRSYSAGLGRYTRRDPISEKGGVNVYLFVDNCVVSMLDLRATRKYSGECIFIGASYHIGGGGFLECELFSEDCPSTCEKCGKEYCRVTAFLAGLALGLPIEIWGSRNTFEIAGTCRDFAGAASLKSVGGAVGYWGMSTYSITLGMGFSSGVLEHYEGIDVGLNMFGGVSWISKGPECHEAICE